MKFKGVKCNEFNACELKHGKELSTYITYDASNSSISIRAIVSSWTQETFCNVRCSIYVSEISTLTFTSDSVLSFRMFLYTQICLKQIL